MTIDNYSALRGIELFKWKVDRLVKLAVKELPPDEQETIARTPGTTWTSNGNLVEFRSAAFPDRVLVQADAEWLTDDCDPSGPELEYVPSADEIPDTIAELTD
ncbi:hypothetical protein R3Q06_32540 [Rhodococcus erythropolis]|uniref:hypothetical protein n=1 Tax=Rhodococcus erythropolis TaxID=1833 RepID=UPI002949CE43|nr:hypothetical protein [Rhodococcus erythropolis]MDV6278195.1 hypothetical protein [Rhodococcus erythropolis]